MEWDGDGNKLVAKDLKKFSDNISTKKLNIDSDMEELD